jgi:DNA-binding CsgD family transcriptional regulator
MAQPVLTGAEAVPDGAPRLLRVPARRTGPPPQLDDPARWEELRAVHSDLRLIAQDLADDVLRSRVHAACARLAALGTSAVGDSSVRLAPRETDVLAMVALGCSNAESARRLSLRPETVKSYLSSAMAKLDAHTRHEAVVRARRLGLLP